MLLQTYQNNNKLLNTLRGNQPLSTFSQKEDICLSTLDQPQDDLSVYRILSIKQTLETLLIYNIKTILEQSNKSIQNT